ncbi:nucleic acid-binding, OB-fold protein, partial [Tanacetum coccineum]
LMATTNYPDTADCWQQNAKMDIAIEPEFPCHKDKLKTNRLQQNYRNKQGTAIQANMDAQDTEHFDRVLELGSAYRITGFSCEHTGLWERTLENPISLAFGKFISVQEIPNTNFPEHYFNFASYNELPARLHLKNTLLTGVSILRTSGNATGNRTHRRMIDIENLSGNIIRLTLWHEKALTFNVQEYEAMEKPVIIAVSSCLVKQFNGLQLSATSATHCYLNPNIPETYHIKQQYQQMATTVPVLNIDHQRYQDLEAEKNRNCFPLATLLAVNLQNYLVIPSHPIPTCKNHGPQPTPTYSVQEIPNTNFPEHYFNFASYNELPARLHLKNTLLTDYIGYIQGVSILRTSGNAIGNRTHRRMIDIENLSGNIIRLTLWHEKALTFNVQEYEAMEKPVIIAVSSCLVKQFNGLQLSATSATHYYLNPNIPETYHIKQQYQQMATTVPVLNIDHQRYQDLEAEKNQNRFPLATLLAVNPQNYLRARFTSDASAYKISTQNKWFYERCASCGKQVIPSHPIPTCKNHGPQPTPTYRAIIGDGSGTISLACFSKQANCLVKDINELLAETPDRNPYHLPAALKELEGTNHIFQFHFDVNSTSNRKPLPEQMVFPEIMVTPPVGPVPTFPLSSEPPQTPPNLSPTEPEPIPIPMNAPTSPALSTTVSNEPQSSVPDIQKPTHPKTTPPGNQNLIEPSKEPKRKNPTESSTRRALFMNNQELEPTKDTKKRKHEDNTKPEP